MLDITPIVDGWDYHPDEVTVRIIEGQDGKPKLQMRLDLGLIQMEYDGRPDGKTPYGYESLLEYYKHQLEQHILNEGTDDGFFLDPDECEALRCEALQYYYRYLSLFHLQQYDAVERDTSRNLRVFNFMKKYAEQEEDQLSLEQYRPYVLMMNARATAHRLLEQNQPEQAIKRIRSTIKKIKHFFRDYERADLANQCSEVLFLRNLMEDIQTNWKNNPVGELRKKMREAVEREDYETAAHIRDQIKQIAKDTSKDNFL